MRCALLVALGLVAADRTWTFQGTESRGWLSPAANPTICDSNVKQYAGYFNIDSATNKNYFYWAFESRSNPATDPTILWLTGGPGCSSMLALLSENGPCTVNKDGATTTNNPYSWNTEANVVWVDQPAGTGFSYSTQAGHDNNEKEVAEDMFNFLQLLFADHKPWQSNNFFIFGESYAGHYVPAVAHRVWQGNQNGEGMKLPLAGAAVGNGLTDPEIQYNYYPDMAYNYSITKLGKPSVSESTYKTMMADLPKCITMITKCQTGSNLACSEAQSYCNQVEIGPYEQTGLNPYDIRKPCGSNPLCYDFSNVDTFLNSAAVQSQLNVSRKWASCNFEVNGAFSADWMKNYQMDFPDLLNSQIPVLIYAGDVDFICNWLGNHAWAENLTWPHTADFQKAQWQDFNVNGKAGGQFKTAYNFTFLRVYDAGHMVPMDQPPAALQMVKTFTKGFF